MQSKMNSPQRKTMVSVRTQISIALDGIREAKALLIQAGVMSNIVDELSDEQHTLLGISMAISMALRAMPKAEVA
jgi:hypothetical protein